MTKRISYRAKGIVLVLGSIIRKHLYIESFQHFLSVRTEIKRNCSKVLPWINNFRLDIKSSKGKHHSIGLLSALAWQVPISLFSCSSLAAIQHTYLLFHIAGSTQPTRTPAPSQLAVIDREDD